MKPILEIKDVSKKYKIQSHTKPYLSLRESLFSFLNPKEKKEEFWALRDVSFNVMPGDTVGIIGRNGAGKSTLLKILSRITPPTRGSIIARGRIASLLEVGTGFHPELSGRENIYLNGSILGMKKEEIRKQFDAIIAFSGIEKFIDTPLKHYSSGMQLRLAFAVAAFLEPEILIIDEVLAVGDAEFQKKCMGKMEDVSRSGRTIIFVSHNTGAVAQLCRTGILLSHGSVLCNEPINQCLQRYLRPDVQNLSGNAYVSRNDNRRSPFFKTIVTKHRDGGLNDAFGFNEQIIIAFEIACNEAPSKDTKLSVTLLDKYQARIFTVVNTISNFEMREGLITLSVTIPDSLIAPNFYSFRYALYTDSGTVFDLLEDVTRISIADTGSNMSLYEGVDYGSVIVDCKWA